MINSLFKLTLKVLQRLERTRRKPGLLDDILGLIVRVKADLHQLGSVVLVSPAVNDQICKEPPHSAA